MAERPQLLALCARTDGRRIRRGPPSCRMDVALSSSSIAIRVHRQCPTGHFRMMVCKHSASERVQSPANPSPLGLRPQQVARRGQGGLESRPDRWRGNADRERSRDDAGRGEYRYWGRAILRVIHDNARVLECRDSTRTARHGPVGDDATTDRLDGPGQLRSSHFPGRVQDCVRQFGGHMGGGSGPPTSDPALRRRRQYRPAVVARRSAAPVCVTSHASGPIP